MPYIRSTSNPEGLYIYSDGESAHVILGCLEIGSLPEKTFDGLLKKYRKYGKYFNYCDFNGAKIEEVWIVSRDNQTVIPGSEADATKNELRMKLSYGNWYVIMWEVTWDYITNI